MSKLPGHFKLYEEHPKSYEIFDERDKKRFHIAKDGINLEMHGNLAKIQKYSKGGKVKDDLINYDDLLPKEAARQAMDRGEINYDPLLKIEAETAADRMPYGVPPGYVAPPPIDTPNAIQLGNQSPQNTQLGQQSPPLQSEITNTKKSADPFAGQNSEMNKGLEDERKALLSGANAEAKAAGNTAKAFEKFDTEVKDLMVDHDNKMKVLNERDNKLFEDAQSKKIDPDRYWNNQSTGEKIGAAIGMALGSIGSAMSGRPSYTIDSINRAIDADIKAQENDKSSAMTLWKMNREATQDQQQATLTTKNMYLTMVQAKAQAYAAAAGGAQAYAKIAPLLAQIGQQKAANNMRISLLQEGQGTGVFSTDPANLVSMVDPKFQTDVAKEITEAKTLAATKKHALETFRRIQEINTLSNRALNPIQASSQIAALAGPLITEVAKMAAGKISDKEVEAFSNIITGATDDPKTNAIKLKNLAGIFDQLKVPGTMFKSKTGIDLDRFLSTKLDDHGPGSDSMKTSLMNYIHQNRNNPDPQVQQRVNKAMQRVQ